MLAFTPVPISSEPMTSASLVHATNNINGHKHGHKALNDPGIYGHVHRAMPQFCCESLLPLLASVPPVSFPINKMHSSVHVLTPPSAVPLQTMSSNKTNGNFVNGQLESLAVPLLPAQPGICFFVTCICSWWLFIFWNKPTAGFPLRTSLPCSVSADST